MSIVDFPMESVATLSDVYSTKPADAHRIAALTKFLRSQPRTWSEVGRFMLRPSMDGNLYAFSTYVLCNGVQLLIADEADELYRMGVARNPHPQY
jgi:hypothetical protein